MNNKYLLPVEQQAVQKGNDFIIFLLNDKKYAVSINNAVEIINIPLIEIPTQTPLGITGMFNYNGVMIKTVDLCPFLGFESYAFSIDNKLIVLKQNEEYFAIHTENIETIKRLEKENIQIMPFSAENSLLNAVYKTQEGSVNIIDCHALYKLISEENIKKSGINYSKLFPQDEKSKNILALRAKKYITHTETFNYNFQYLKQYILFTLNNQNYYLDIQHVKEFVSMKRLNITKLPYTPSYIEGLVRVKGEFLVVVNLKKFMNLQDNEQLNQGKLIVVEGKNFNIALLVDDIKYIKNLNTTDTQGMYSSSQNYISKEFMENNTLYSILNYEKIINDDKMYINIE